MDWTIGDYGAPGFIICSGPEYENTGESDSAIVLYSDELWTQEECSVTSDPEWCLYIDQSSIQVGETTD